MVFIIERKEAMSPDGYLRLFIQDDGDVIVAVGQGCSDGGIDETASVEFCTPFGGGGGSSRTHQALTVLAKAMAEDNADRQQQNRAGEFDGKDLLASWSEQDSAVEPGADGAARSTED